MLKNSSVNIIGFGIAGALTSISLLKKGFEVNVFEEHGRDNPVFCSGVISRYGTEYIKKHFFNPMEALESKIYGANIYIGNTILKIRNDNSVAFAFNRNLFDELARKKAEKMGTNVVYNKRLEERDIIKLKKPIIGADGPFSITAKTFKFPKIKKYIYGFYSYVKEKPKDYVEVYLNNSFPGFFGWKIPKKNKVEVGFGVNNIKYINKAIRFFNKKEWMGSVIPIRLRKSIEKDNVYLIGDAAGLVKSATGGGIVFTSYAANILGDALKRKKSYEKLLKDLKKELFIHTIIQKGFEILSFLNYPFADFLKTLKIDEYLSKNGNMDFPTKFVNITSFLKYLLQT